MPKSGNIRIVGLVFLVGIFVFIVGSSSIENGMQFSTVAYSSAFQGPKAMFEGVTYNGLQYTAANGHGASAHSFDTTMNFDADGASSGKPKIQGEMTAIFLPQDSLQSAPAWLPISWLQNNGLISNPMTGPGGVNPPWSWNISDSSGNSNVYTMKEFDMRYYVSLSSAWSGSEDPSSRVDPVLEPIVSNAYNNVGVWIEFDISPSWYIQGGGTAYFAIAELNLAENVQMQAKDNNGATYTARTDEAVTPESRQSVVSLYYGGFGIGSTQTSTPYQYQGRDLNPAYFTNKLYAHIDLNNFGTWSGASNFLWTYTRGDVATFAFDMKVFVIGEYKVQDIQQNPDQYGRTTPITNNGANWFSNIIGWLSSPYNATLVIGVIIFAAVLLFAPWLLVAIIALFGGKR